MAAQASPRKTDDQVRRQLEALIASPVLANSVQLCRFLRHIVERTLTGDAASLKEPLLGGEVFDRGKRFDPRTDPVVRVEARRLRSKLEQYYSTSGRSDGVVIRLPKGTYVPVFDTAVQARIAVVRPIAAMEPAAAQPSVAVLPFVSVGSDPETEYFADGLTDEIINLLGHIDGLSVVARSSVYQFKSRTADAREAGRRLTADYIVEGSVRCDVYRLRIAAQLVEARNGYQVWAQTFERDWKQIFAIQQEIATAIASRLRLRTGGSRTPLYTKNLEAYNTYLKGRFYWNKRTVPAFQSAIEAFQQAIQLEPQYAPAWAGLADCYSMLGFMHVAPPSEIRQKARAAADRAIELDDQLPAALIARANLVAIYDWEWDPAIDGMRRAIALEPNSAEAHYGLSKTLATLGRFDEALAEIDRAQQLDPLSLMFAVSRGWELAAARRYAESDAAYDAARELDRNFIWAYVLQSWSYEARGRFTEAIAAMRRATELGGTSPFILGELAHALGKTGNVEEAQRLLEQLEALGSSQYVSPFDLARAYEGLGRRSDALAAMFEACEERSPMILFVGVDPVFDPFRGDPGFQELLKRLRLAK